MATVAVYALAAMGTGDDADAAAAAAGARQRALVWVHEAGNPYFDWMFGSAVRAREVIGRWMQRKSSEVAAEAVRIVTVDGVEIGGFLCHDAGELRKRRLADSMAMLKEFPADQRDVLRRRIEQSQGLFRPPEAGEYYLSKFGINPEQRGCGRGKILLQECLNFSRAQGYATMSLDVAADNAPARGLYGQAGFEVVSSASIAGGGEISYVAMSVDLSVESRTDSHQDRGSKS